MSFTLALRAVERAEKAGWTRVQVAEACGLSRHAVDRFVHGREPKPHVVEALVAFGRHWQRIEEPLDI